MAQGRVLGRTLQGLYYLRSKRIIHCDLKPSNLVLTKDGILKIIDFGLAQKITTEHKKRKASVCTRWYRPPEIFLGYRYYGTEVDMWSAGCVIGELALGYVLMPGESDSWQPVEIADFCGPVDDLWPEVVTMPHYDLISGMMDSPHPPKIRRVFSRFSLAFQNMMQDMLTVNPLYRLDLASAINHKFFREQPQASREDLCVELKKSDYFKEKQ